MQPVVKTKSSFQVDELPSDFAMLDLNNTGKVARTFAEALDASQEVKSVVGNKTEAKAEFKQNGSKPEEHKKTPSKLQIKKAKNLTFAHDDDLHAMIQITPERFVTGSKDCSLKIWDVKGSKVLDAYKPDEGDYFQWITALTKFDDNQWLSGTRDGLVHLWDNKGKQLQELYPKPKQSGTYLCKERNLNRINCLSSGVDSVGKKIFFVGWPTQFTIHSAAQKEEHDSLGHCQTSENDWVFSVTQLDPTRFLVVTGARLDIYQSDEKYSQWKNTAALITEKVRAKGHQRPFISAVTPLQNNPGQYSLAIFGGEVSIIDLKSGKKTVTYKEHNGRVWTTVEIPESRLLASCSDDHTIKLWDARISKSVHTLKGNIGRVSTLLHPKEFLLVSGSCPDNLKSTKDKAILTFWDIRRE